MQRRRERSAARGGRWGGGGGMRAPRRRGLGMRRGAAAAGRYSGRRRSGAGLIVGLIVLALVGLAVWYFATHNSLAAPVDTPAPSVTVTIGSPSPSVAGSSMFKGYSDTVGRRGVDQLASLS